MVGIGGQARTASCSMSPPPSLCDNEASVVTGSAGIVRDAAVNLPKLTIQPVKGDLTAWTTFWDSYILQSMITPPSDINKFNYFRSLLQASHSTQYQSWGSSSDSASCGI